MRQKVDTGRPSQARIQLWIAVSPVFQGCEDSTFPVISKEDAMNRGCNRRRGDTVKRHACGGTGEGIWCRVLGREEDEMIDPSERPRHPPMATRSSSFIMAMLMYLPSMEYIALFNQALSFQRLCQYYVQFMGCHCPVPPLYKRHSKNFNLPSLTPQLT